jgi:hypothetical protein
MSKKKKKEKTQMAYHAHTLVYVLIDGRVILDKCCLRLTLNLNEKNKKVSLRYEYSMFIDKKRK